MVLSATLLAFLHYTHTHAHTNRLMAVFGYVHVQSLPPPPSPPPCVTSPFLGHVTLLYIDCGHFGFESHIKCPFVYTTDALQKGVTQLGGKRRNNNLFSVTVFRPFLTEETQHVQLFVFLFLFSSLSLSLSFTEDQMLLSQASRDLKS